jgi:hypothetical protein
VPVRRWQSDATQAHAPHAPPPRVMHELNRRGGARAGKGDAPRRGLWCAHVRAEPARHAQDGAAQVKRALAGATVVAGWRALPQLSAMDLDLFLASDPWRLSPHSPPLASLDSRSSSPLARARRWHVWKKQQSGGRWCRGYRQESRLQSTDLVEFQRWIGVL